MVSPLRASGVVSDTSALVVRVGTPHPVYRVKAWESIGAVMQSLATAGAGAFPGTVGATAWASATCRVLCVGPGEWTVVGARPLLFDAASVAVAELTDGFARVALGGEAVEELLAGLCTLDLHPAVFGVNSCARTRLAGIGVLLDRLGVQEFACYAPRSFLSYLLAALHEAARGVRAVRFEED